MVRESQPLQVRRCVVEMVSYLACLRAAAALAAPANLNVWDGQCINECSAPCEAVPTLPWHQCKAIWRLSIPLNKTGRLLGSRNVSSLECSPNNVIELLVSCGPAGAAFAWGSHTLRPSLRPTAIRIASSLKRSPHTDTGKANNQSLLCGDFMAWV